MILEGDRMTRTIGARAEWLDLHKLRVFAAVAEHEHVSRAATELRMSQPALSAHVHDLERHFGAPLIERAGRNIRLTEAGRVARDYARRILALTVELDEAMDDLQELRAGQLRLGASVTVGAYLLPADLGVFRRHYPDVTVTVEIVNTETIVDRLRHGELHLGLISDGLEDPEVEVEPYRDDELVTIVPPDHRWAGAEIEAAALAAEPLILREHGSATRAIIEQALAGAGVQPAIGLELGSTEAVKGAVAAGLGFSFVSACAVVHELADGRLARTTVRGLALQRQFQIARRRGRRLTAAETAFMAMLRDTAVRVGAEARPPQGSG